MARPYTLRSPYARYPLTCRPGTSDLYAFWQIFVECEYACLDDCVNPNLIIDCGANVGFSSAYFLSRFPQTAVIAVEPEPGNFGMLEINLRPYGSRAQLVKSAVWSHPTELVISREPYRDGREWSTQVRECRSGETADLRAVDIGTLLDRSGHRTISILKVDVERAEAEIFSRNYESWIERVDAIVIELHDEECTRIFHRAIATLPFELSRSGELTVCKKRSERIETDRAGPLV
ncbi:MAG: FkbM family methyltransferase [Nitrospirae bacterium]|nr:MAG: FkbM family methyltransferase [Nitrospirota bacterium]